MSDQQNQEAVGAVSVFAPITHPVLKSVDPVAVSAFLKDRKRYERQVEERQGELPSLKPASFAVSIDPGLLETMVFLGEFDDIAPDTEPGDLTSEEIEKFIQSLVKSSRTGFDPNVIEGALRGLRVPARISDPKARMFH